jgi:hypothetical protein
MTLDTQATSGDGTGLGRSDGGATSSIGIDGKQRKIHGMGDKHLLSPIYGREDLLKER